MPHCIIEYSATLERQLSPAGLVAAVHGGAEDSGLFGAADIKTRAVGYEHHQAGSHKRDFIHVTLKILSGRSQEQRAALSASVLDALQSLGLSDISLTVDVVEMERESYAKWLG
ncbi:5-carboxymethyl-2-hydroxymuconate isomerase [Zobellella endophytica]|uniref:5-carboxymethyl-2-hydroxymuconate isomerase n=1 Tax=Zobellella endophytica TaxID=2116700 RepID=A0A2P7QQT6_9GAMM|nr:5-carboxymethyl-2-hydroxymuconate Delta-isomerase [Zobellella endophytica]PSJ40338.1 5-carboxymethyl-2-hydroxymuconate isomerase [Zobellella endophytica]